MMQHQINQALTHIIIETNEDSIVRSCICFVREKHVIGVLKTTLLNVVQLVKMADFLSDVFVIRLRRIYRQ